MGIQQKIAMQPRAGIARAMNKRKTSWFMLSLVTPLALCVPGALVTPPVVHAGYAWATGMVARDMKYLDIHTTLIIPAGSTHMKFFSYSRANGGRSVDLKRQKRYYASVATSLK